MSRCHASGPGAAVPSPARLAWLFGGYGIRPTGILTAPTPSAVENMVGLATAST